MRASLPFSTPLLGSSLAFALLLMATPGLAQTAAPATLQPRVAPAANAPTYTLIHVSAAAGSNLSGDGSQQRPYQTITHALGVAPVNTIVLLAPGEYSEASGEQFPIQLRPGVTVQGLPTSALGQTVIRGSGIFASATAGLVQTTLVGADGSGLGHVTVTNPSTAGYGLVIEAGRPLIRQNQFVGSGYGGVYVSGSSTPMLESNQFQGNGVVGLRLEGETTAEVRGNRFEQTGIGIRVAPGAQPQILNNTIIHNQDGILLDGHASPTLQDNVISQNRRNGVVEFQTALKAEDPMPAASQLPISPTASDRQTSGELQTPATTAMTMAPPGRDGVLAVPSVDQGTPSPSILTTPPPNVAAAAPATPRAEIAQPAEVEVAEVEVAEVEPAEVEVAEEMNPAPEVPTATLAVALPLQSAAASDETTPPVATSPAPPNPAPLATGTTPIAMALPVTANLPDPAALARATSDLPEIPVRATQSPIPARTAPATPSPDPDPAASSPVQSAAPSAAAPSHQVAPPSDTVLAARESFRRWRQTSQGSEDPAAPTPAPSAEAEAGSIPIAVIPPPATTLARASEPSPTDSASRPAPNATPSSSMATSTNLLPVPSRTIPRGEGSSSLPNLAPPSTTLALNGAPPAPPSHGGLLGLVYTVVVPAADAATQAQVRSAVADAFRVNWDGQTMMQVGAYADQATAEAQANDLIDLGFAARVEYRP
ncbi:MAG: DUF1565 domain-containing protein [Leptolyngbya sp.]|nr:DUF1565 domain-containing protein [Leptolyngbya sp.]